MCRFLVFLVFLALSVQSCTTLSHLSTIMNKRGDVVTLLSFDGPGGGTGFQVRTEDGAEFLVTNDHVCDRASAGRMYAITEAGDTKIVQVLYHSPTTDLCFMSPIEDLKPFKLAKNLDMAKEVIALGHPKLRRLTETRGVIRWRQTIDILMGPVTEEEPCDKPKNFQVDFWLFGKLCGIRVRAVQSTAPIEPGSSGSPALNLDGEVIGVFFAMGSDSFFVPLEDLVQELDNASK